MSRIVTPALARAKQEFEAAYELWWRHREHIGGDCLCRMASPLHAPLAIRAYRKERYVLGGRAYPEAEGEYVVTDAQGTEYCHYAVRPLDAADVA